MRVDLLHGVGEVEQRAFAGAGAAAAHVDRRHRRLVEHDRGDAGRQRGIVGVTDADAGNIGEEIFQSTRSPKFRYPVNGYSSRAKTRQLRIASLIIRP